MVETLSSTPREDGFRMPGEFEEHERTWMLWPQDTDAWRMGAVPAQEAYTEVANAIARFEPVTVGATADQYQYAREHLSPEIRVVEISYNSAWVRDNGPTFLTNDRGEIRGIDWTFNAWGGLEGGLTFPWDKDDQIAQKVLEMESTARYDSELVLEGGGIHVDGEGTVITTESCLLNSNRNPDWSKARVEEELREYLNVEKVVWLPQGMHDSATNGHIDGVLNYVSPGEVVISWTDDPDDPHYEIVRATEARLNEETDAAGREFEIHRLHMPGEMQVTAEETRGGRHDAPGETFYGTYTNYYICNGGVVVPTYDDPQDERAIETLSEIYSDRDIVGVNGREMTLNGGMVHCITQQQPKA